MNLEYALENLFGLTRADDRHEEILEHHLGAFILYYSGYSSVTEMKVDFANSIVSYFLRLQKVTKKACRTYASTRSASWQAHYGKVTSGVRTLMLGLSMVSFQSYIQPLAHCNLHTSQMTSTFPDALSHESFTPALARTCDDPPASPPKKHLF